MVQDANNKEGDGFVISSLEVPSGKIAIMISPCISNNYCVEVFGFKIICT